ncbi:MAG TPA: hypothetical protein VK081_05300 [Planctomycetota bacterium]|nr:hypothetical protein [Planctomycetota bacterium]
MREQDASSEDFPSTWAPRGEVGRLYGRAGMTAANLVTLALLYRYCRLEPALTE